MNRLFSVAIGCTVAASLLFNGHSAAVFAQVPEAEPAAPQAPDVESSPSEPNSSQPPSSEPSGAEPSESQPSGAQPSESEPSESGATAPAVPEGYQEVTGDGWSFAVPSDWQNLLSEPVDLGEDTNLVAQLTDSQKQTIVNLVVQDYKGDNNDYLDQSVKTLSDLGTLHAQEPITTSGWQGLALDFSLSSNDPPTRLLQRVIAANGTGFALTCGGREENFTATESVCTTILKTFQVTPP